MFTNLPAKRYPIFQTAFEKKVAEIQLEIKKLDELQGLYSRAREALIKANLDNEVRLEMYGQWSTVSIRIYLKDGDTMDTFHPLLGAIGDGLTAHRLHHDGLPAERQGDYDRTFVWRCGPDGTKKLELILDVPWNGTDCIEIQTEEKHVERTEIAHRAIWHSQPYRPSRSAGQS